MKKFTKAILIVFCVVVLFILAASIIVPRVLEPNQYKGKIADMVKKKTGRDLTLGGDISISVFPWLGATIEAIEVGNATGFEASAFARVEQAKVRVKLLPLLSRKIEAGVITIEGLVLNLERSPDGRANWENLVTPAEAPADAVVETKPSGAPSLAALAVGGLDIRDSRISWNDRQTGTNITVKNLGLKTSAINLVGPVTARLQFNLDTGESIPVVLDLQVQGDLNRKTFKAGPVTLSVADMTATADLDLSQTKSGSQISGTLAVAPFNLREFLTRLGAVPPNTADPRSLSTASVDIKFHADTGTTTIDGLSLRLDDSNITGKAEVRLSPSPAYAIDIAVDNIDVDRYLPPKAAAGTNTATEAAQAPTPGTAAAAIPTELLQSLDLDARLSVGALKIANLHLTDIQLQAISKEGLLALHPLNADLYGGAYSGNIQIDARGPAPLLSLDENLAGVRSGDLLKDLQGKTVISGLASAGMKLTATGANADALMDSLDGTVSFTFTDGSVKGVDIVGKICQTLMAANAGTMETEDLVKSALQMLVQKAGGTESTESETDAEAEADSTKFSEISGSMTFANGVGTSEDLSLKSPMLRVEGAGSLDLSRQHLDYDATATLVKSCEGQGGEGFADLEKIQIPVTIKGPLDDLEVRPNLTAGILELLARKQGKPADEALETAPDQPPEDPESMEEPETVEGVLQEMLQDLLKQE